MECILCQFFPKEQVAMIEMLPEMDQSRHIPAPVIERPAGGDHRVLTPQQGRGPEPGSRSPQLTDARYQRRPGTPTAGLRPYERSVTRPQEIGPTGDHIPMTRSTVEAGHLRAVRLKYVQPGGPAMTAPNQFSWGWIHNYGYLTIGDTLKPAQQLPRYNQAAVDTQTVLDRARSALMRTLYGG